MKLASIINSIIQQLSRFQDYWLPAIVSLAVLSAILLPLNLLTTQRLHHDEALYATWALKIVSGDDPWLTDTPIDKPPLFLYVVAGTLRLLGPTESATRAPSLLATALTVFLTFCLGRKLYGNGVGVLAAWLVALSPFTLLFAPTAFTDPMLVALVLAGCVAAVHNQAGWAGVCLGLAIATKQQGIFFVPLPMALLMLNTKVSGISVTESKSPNKSKIQNLKSKIKSLLLTLIPFLVWDFTRSQPSSFFEQSARNYGGLTIDVAGFGERWAGFIDLLYYGTASPTLNTIFVAGCCLLLIYGVWQMAVGDWRLRIAKIEQEERQLSNAPANTAQTDWLLFLFVLVFLMLHSALSFQVWDRYLLGLIPFLALLLARVLLLPWSILKNHWGNLHTTTTPWPGLINGLGTVLLLAFTLTVPIQDAVNARYPLGSNSRALDGIEQITAYLQGHAGANNTLYHHWLGTHWRFYLWDYPYDLQYWDSPEELVVKAQPGQLIAHPAWRSDTELRLSLFKAGLTFHELTRAYTPGGSPSIILYQIEAVP